MRMPATVLPLVQWVRRHYPLEPYTWYRREAALMILAGFRNDDEAREWANDMRPGDVISTLPGFMVGANAIRWALKVRGV